MITNGSSEDHLVEHNREFHGFLRTGVPVEWRNAAIVARNHQVLGVSSAVASVLPPAG
jgi:hypothetical protein